jgi:MYXO-CTERM domain-containing protein
VFLGVDIAEDTAAPKISLVDLDTSDGLQIRARVHDNKTPVMPHDFTEVVVEFVAADDAMTSLPMTWYGEALWRLRVDEVPVDSAYFQVCATDAAGNSTCDDGHPLGGGSDTSGGGESTGGEPTGGETTVSGDDECGLNRCEPPPTSGDTDVDSDPDTGASTGDTTPIDDDKGCGCRHQPAPLGSLLFVGAALLVRRRRR